MTGTTARRGFRWRRVVAAFLVLLVGWLVWCFVVIVNPKVDAPGPVDAVLVLGGLPTDDRTARALQLVDAGLTDTVLISTPSNTDRRTRALCADPPAGVRVICFPPDPATTRGEVRFLARTAEENDWSRVAVVTSPYHLSRSRMLADRCYPGTVEMVASREHVSVGRWAYNFAYQTAGYLKAAVLRSC